VNDKTLYTIGHSTRTLDELVDILKSHGVKVLADVRSIPKSRHVPQFNQDALKIDLPQRGIRYQPMAELGGRRHTRKDSPNTGWRNASFRGYADYMQTPEFEAGIEHLIKIATQSPTAIMCAEAVPWRCHRSLIGDAMLVRGWTVLDLMGVDKQPPHKLTPFAKVDGLEITYPTEDPELFS